MEPRNRSLPSPLSSLSPARFILAILLTLTFICALIELFLRYHVALKQKFNGKRRYGKSMSIDEIYAHRGKFWEKNYKETYFHWDMLLQWYGFRENFAFNLLSKLNFKLHHIVNYSCCIEYYCVIFFRKSIRSAFLRYYKSA